MEIKILFLGLLLTSFSMYGANPTPLRSTGINNADLPALLDSPGYYYITDNLIYPATSATPAITINSSNVTIDFERKSLQQTGGLLSVTAIQIGSGLMNVNLLNGLITDFSSSAISVASGSSFMVFDSLTISDCGNRCIELIGSPVSPVRQIEITNDIFLNSCTLTTADNVLTISNCTDIKLDNDIFSTNGSSSAAGTIAIIQFTNTSRYIASNVGMSNSSGNSDLRGISFINSSGGFFDTCKVSSGRAFGATGFSRGIYLTSSSQLNFFTNCLCANLTANTVDGFFSDTGCSGNIFENCTSAAHIATGVTGVAHGFRCINNSKIKLENCESRGHTAATSTASPYGAYAYKFDTVTTNAVLDCVGSYCSAPAGSSVGYYIFQSTQCVFRENQASDNTQGFDFQGTFTQNTFIKNIAERNTNASQYSGFPAGAIFDAIGSDNINTISSPWTNIGIS